MRLAIYGTFFTVALAAVIFIMFQPPSEQITASSSIDMIHNKNSVLSFGDQDAPVSIVEYSSFQCPNCRTLHENTGSLLKEKIADGTVHYTFKHVAFEHFAFDNVIFEHVTEENSADLETVSHIFSSQPAWSNYSDAADVLKDLKLNSPAGEIDERQVEMEQAMWEFEELGLRGVPTMFINGRQFSGSYDEAFIRNIIEEESR
ncbi:hypothetical protein CR205_09280 [Alteribacter lacisalsi]|uniref:Thioredoxin-like fold domain-containing protein n=1 Tax=Alteribacter lacisalsi TaxID=2045244 RepID=A0A2W0HC36_9BACI|nr:thioredoxin domain-containing protein [Alteribacter lacisalsi]PYZ98747.1 hypothetical protein CR205_09280 [Alteribacter lacisalsi]